MSMTGTRSITAMLVATLGLSVAACSTLDENDYCRYSREISIGQADPESLALVLGIGKERAKETPFVVVRSISKENPGVSVRLRATPAAHPLPASLDESRCARIDWSTYSLSVDAEAWRAFWQDDRNSPFEIFIAFLDSNEPLRMGDFGAAIVDTAVAEHLVACGCYWR
jgi:hypothetical protein